MLGARGPMLEVVADASFLTEPVSCEVSNAVGSANRSTALDVQCKSGGEAMGVAKCGASKMGQGATAGLGCYGLRGGGGAGVGFRRDKSVLDLGQSGAGAGQGGAGDCERSCGLGALTQWALVGVVPEGLIPSQKLQSSLVM